LKIIAAIEDPPVIDKILSHLGLSTRAPPRAPARRGEPKTGCQTQADGAARSESETEKGVGSLLRYFGTAARIERRNQSKLLRGFHHPIFCAKGTPSLCG
jgi:hypothetical protein